MENRDFVVELLSVAKLVWEWEAVKHDTNAITEVERVFNPKTPFERVPEERLPRLRAFVQEVAVNPRHHYDQPLTDYAKYVLKADCECGGVKFRDDDDDDDEEEEEEEEVGSDYDSGVETEDDSGGIELVKKPRKIIDVSSGDDEDDYDDYDDYDDDDDDSVKASSRGKRRGKRDRDDGNFKYHHEVPRGEEQRRSGRARRPTKRFGEPSFDEYQEAQIRELGPAHRAHYKTEQKQFSGRSSSET